MRVLVYALSTCIHCKNAKKFLDDSDVAYEVVHVDSAQGEERKQLIDEVKKFNPACSFPTILIGDEPVVVVGFRKDQIKEALGL